MLKQAIPSPVADNEIDDLVKSIESRKPDNTAELEQIAADFDASPIGINYAAARQESIEKHRRCMIDCFNAKLEKYNAELENDRQDIDNTDSVEVSWLETPEAEKYQKAYRKLLNEFSNGKSKK